MPVFTKILRKTWLLLVLALLIAPIFASHLLFPANLWGFVQSEPNTLLVLQSSDSGNSPNGELKSTPRVVSAGEPSGSPEKTGEAAAAKSQRLAVALMDRMLEYLAWGPAFEAKLRMRAWAHGQTVTEVGRYLQAGQGTGRIYMDLHVPIADGNGRWQQTCDGRLAWTREELGVDVRVRRVDLGLLEELLVAGMFANVPPRFRIGGLAEIIDRILMDYDLSISEGYIENVRMLVVKGTMRSDVVADLKRMGDGHLSSLVPQHVRVAIPADSVESPLPTRIEFWSEPAGRLISLLEVYDVAAIEDPPAERFRFEAGGEEYVQETEYYLRRFRDRRP